MKRIFLVFLLVLLMLSCQKNIEYIGYNDLLESSPILLWGSSKDDVKNKYPNVEERDNALWEYNLNGRIIQRFFDFIGNELYFVGVSYGNYSNDALGILKNVLEKEHGIFTIEDNGTIETWHIKTDENNNIVFVINKLENNMVNCSYINPVLRDKYEK